MKIIFMGTPDFAVPALQALISSTHQVQAVFTQMPKPKNRGHLVTASVIGQLAAEYNIPVFTPKTLKTAEVQAQIAEIEADIIIVVAYGFIIPKTILENKRYGCLNIHPSQLPKFRGAAPLQHTILNGELDTAVCIMQMDEGLDTGPIILKQQFALPADIDLPTLHDQCSHLGAKLLLQVLDNIETLPRIPQDNINVSYANKLNKEHGKVDWNMPSSLIDCQIRALNPWPGTYFTYKDETIKILKASIDNTPHKHTPGTIINDDFAIACAAGIIRPQVLQRIGKKSLSIAEFKRGFAITKGDVIS
jgi:methionyl-tRNA formyltransferase